MGLFEGEFYFRVVLGFAKARRRVEPVAPHTAHPRGFLLYLCLC